MKEEDFPYNDILERPHHISKRHPQMPLIERAAQFSPFAALTGYEKLILESGRFTKKRPELSEDAKRELDEKLQRILSRQKCDEICMTKDRENRGDEKWTGETEISYFEEDPFKEGGTIKKIRAVPMKIDNINGILVLKDKTKIPIADIFSLE